MWNDGDIFKTKDSDLACYLLTQDDKFRMTGVETTQGERDQTIVWFLFEPLIPQDAVGELLRDYRNGVCLVEPRKYAYRRRQIKNIIHKHL